MNSKKIGNTMEYVLRFYPKSVRKKPALIFST